MLKLIMCNEGWEPRTRNIYEAQWEEQIKEFLRRTEAGEALVDGGYVAVDIGDDPDQPRFVYYKEGDDCLTDDDFTVQHSRRLYWEEISAIKRLTKQIYGVDIYIPDDTYYDEVYGDYDEEGMDETIVRLSRKALSEAKRRIMEGAGVPPKSVRGRINQIYNAVNAMGLSSKKFRDENWAALRMYDETIEGLGYELTYWVEDGGYGDYDEYTGMPTSKTYMIRIGCGDGMDIDGYIKMMAAGSVEDPFDAYDTCMVLWPARSSR